MSLTRSARWSLIVLAVLSLASFLSGFLLTTGKITRMETTIVAGSATGVEVYAGQAWTVLGAGLVTAGLIGMFLTLAATAIATRRPVAAQKSPVPSGSASDEPAAPSSADIATESATDALVEDAPPTAVSEDEDVVHTA